ncbi:MBL fold metallo-hydrolase [Sessilibacter corallicola]|uniref:MBL fold metallo-hydrolase n=1 Tax=Sessilibacter corallicola TaxID=2904075 RepID=UPI001E56E93C|nr:MBL fold metallo-hydrolase [Sessilibacter corallicola]MCE2028972.1 MBL fold metallo-hydrolase [Sessilibacter corallicola]
MSSDKDKKVSLRLLGQSGFRMEFNNTVLYIDPYLSDSVRKFDSPELERLIPIPINPEEINDADWVLLTHDHLDHCDPETVGKIAIHSPSCKFYGPISVIKLLRSWGFDESRLVLCSENEHEVLADGINIRITPAAHPEITRDENGRFCCVGFLLSFEGKLVYISGDTCITDELYDFLKELPVINVAMLPINERNYFKERFGTIGNMSVREAFTLAHELKIEKVIPSHGDMFHIHSVSKEELEVVHRDFNFDFELLINPTEL